MFDRNKLLIAVFFVFRRSGAPHGHGEESVRERRMLGKANSGCVIEESHVRKIYYKRGLVMKNHTKSQRIISVICALLMVITLLPTTGWTAKAAATPYYLTCLDIGNDGDFALNKADIGSISAKINSTVTVEGWVLSTVKFTSYTVYLSKGSNPPSKTIEANAGTYPFSSTDLANFQTNTGKTFITANSHWKAKIPLTDITTGTWTISVVGRVSGNANSTYDIAKVTLNVTSPNNSPNNFAVCNGDPNPDPVKNFTINTPSKITIPNHFVIGNTTSFNANGWAIHDRGIDTYFYTIKNKSTGKVVSGKENKSISAKNRTDLGTIAETIGIAATNNVSHTWYYGPISISGMTEGDYVAYIYGKTLDGQTFSVAEISFKIKNPKASITAKEGNTIVTEIFAPIKGITKTLNIQVTGVNGNWNVTSSQSWVKVTPDVNNKKLTITVDENEVATPRTATITLTCGGAEYTIPVSQEAPEKLTFNYMSTDDVIYTGTCYYSDKYFNTSATKYDPSLSTMSMCLAMSAFATTNTEKQYRCAELLLRKCGFKFVEVNGDYKSVPNEDTMGVIIGFKEITTNEGKVTLIALVTRGAGYHNEWSGNFNVGPTGNHKGFSIAKDKAKMMLNEYVDKYAYLFNSKVKLWVTGYSRGAATVNLLAGEVSASGKIGKTKSISVSKENIYAYCFEPPRGLNTSVCSAANAAKYTNIHNIVNPDDIVPEVALAGWGFIRYGVDEAVIPSIKTDTQYRIKVNKMMTYYKAIGGGQRQASGKLEKSIVSLSEYESHKNEVLKGIEDKIREWGDPTSQQLTQLKNDFLAGKKESQIGSIKFGYSCCTGYGMFSNAYDYQQGLLRMRALQSQGSANKDKFLKVNLFRLRKYDGTLRSITGIQNILQYGNTYTADYSVTQGEAIKTVLNGLAGKLTREQYYNKVQKGLTLLAREYFKESSIFDKMEIMGGVLLPHNWLTLFKIGISSITNGDTGAHVKTLIQKTLVFAFMSSGGDVQKQLKDAFSSGEINTINNSIAVLAQALVDMMANQNMSDTLLSLIFSAETIGMAHYPELCLSWLQSFDPKY